MTDRRGLARLATLVGGSTALYAVALAAVTGMQSSADARTIAGRQPVEASLDAVTATNDELEARLRAGAEAYDQLANGYDQLTIGLTGLDGAVGELNTAVGDVSGRAAELPTSVNVPRLTRPSTSVTVTRTTVVHATTGASG